MYDIDADPKFKMADASEILRGFDIELFFLDSNENPREEWQTLQAKHGDRIAVAKQYGDEFWISWHYAHPEIAEEICEAFQAVDLPASWSGDARDTVKVSLIEQKCQHTESMKREHETRTEVITWCHGCGEELSRSEI